LTCIDSGNIQPETNYTRGNIQPETNTRGNIQPETNTRGNIQAEHVVNLKKAFSIFYLSMIDRGFTGRYCMSFFL
jgi:hypothetical protein